MKRWSIGLLAMVLVFGLLLPAGAAAADIPDGAGAANTPEASAEPVALSAPERVFQVIGLLILLGGIALLPVYYVLNIRRKRIIRSFDASDRTDRKPDEETDSPQ